MSTHLPWTPSGLPTADGTLPWSAVRAVGVRTTDEGPWCEDVFWMLLLDEGLIELPGALVSGEAVGVLGRALPGFDHEAVIRAMGSTEPRVFRVWQAEPTPGFADRDGAMARHAALMARLGAEGPVDGAFDTLWAGWSAPERRYHDRRHLAACLGWLDRSPLPGADRDRAELALWWHDAVMTGRAPEAASAEAMRAACGPLGLDAATLDRVATLILATVHTGPPVEDPVADVVVDCDLAILASDPVGFLDFEDGVREEYAHVPDAAFAVGRARVLRGMLERPVLYRSAWGRERFEARARSNLAATLGSERYAADRRWGGLVALMGRLVGL